MIKNFELLVNLQTSRRAIEDETSARSTYLIGYVTRDNVYSLATYSPIYVQHRRQLSPS